MLLAVYLTLISATVVTGTALFTIIVPNDIRGLCMSVLAAALVLFGVASAPLLGSGLAGLLGGDGILATALAWVCVLCGLLAIAAFGIGTRMIADGNGIIGALGDQRHQ